MAKVSKDTPLGWEGPPLEPTTPKSTKPRPPRKGSPWLWVFLGFIFILVLASISQHDTSIDRVSSPPSSEATLSTSSPRETGGSGISPAGVSSQEEVSVPAFHLHGTRDVSFSVCVRLVADVVLQKEEALSDEQLIHIAQQVVNSIISTKRVNAISVAFWGPESSIGQGLAAAVVEWAPEGLWEKADTVKSGDYSKHRFRVYVNRTAELATSPTVSLDLATRKEIYYNLVALQDRIPIDDPQYSEKNADAFRIIAEQYGISIEEVHEIAMEGIRKAWPLPPSP